METQCLTFTEVINSRRSTRTFLDKEIEPEKISRIIDTISKCPTAGNYHAYHITVVKDKEVIRKIAHDSWDQSWIAEVC